MNNKIAIFPNPANDFINIQSNSEITKTEIQDLNGRMITKENQNSENIVLNINLLSKGIYLLKIENKNGILVKKFFKE